MSSSTVATSSVRTHEHQVVSNHMFSSNAHKSIWTSLWENFVSVIPDRVNQTPNFDGYKPLVAAIKEDDWDEANEYLKNHKKDIKEIFAARDSKKEIHMIFNAAAIREECMFVEEFIELVPSDALEFVDPETAITVLHMAAMVGNNTIVKALVKKNPNLPQIRSSDIPPVVPLTYAAMKASDLQKETVEFLYSVTRDEDPSPFSGILGSVLLSGLIQANAYGIALSILGRHPELVGDMYSSKPLEMIVERPFAFLTGAELTWWERFIYSLIPVHADGPYDYAIRGDRENNLATSKGTTKDEENPPETSTVSTKLEGSSSNTDERTITKYFMPYFLRVPRIAQLYNQKLMHKQAVALVKYVLAVYGQKKDDTEIITGLFINPSILETAIKYGTTEFVLECLHVFPMLCGGDHGEKLIRMVITERNEKVFSYICQIKKRHYPLDRLPTLDERDNSILHHTAKLAPNRRLNSVSGAALQMQREMQWFKGVADTMIQKARYIRNKDGDTAQFLLTDQHKDLMEKGEKWMKDTSGSCMVVATLIATVAFAAAFTVPGGNISDTSKTNNGVPIFLEKTSFIVFVVADALALLSSITSVLMFLAILTSRYSEEDFLKSLPLKLIIGLATLFISMATILISFGAAVSIVLSDRYSRAAIPITLCGCIPVLLFAFLQLPLFVEMIRSTYWPITFGEKSRNTIKKKPKKRKLN